MQKHWLLILCGILALVLIIFFITLFYVQNSENKSSQSSLTNQESTPSVTSSPTPTIEANNLSTYPTVINCGTPLHVTACSEPYIEHYKCTGELDILRCTLIK